MKTFILITFIVIIFTLLIFFVSLIEQLFKKLDWLDPVEYILVLTLSIFTSAFFFLISHLLIQALIEWDILIINLT